MADSITDEELVRELQSFGETVKLPIKSVKRGVLIKKLNHLRVKAEKSQAELFKKPAPVGRGRRGARSPRSPIGGFSSDESDVGDPESQDRVTGKKKLQTANRRSSSRLTALVDSGIGKTAVGKQIKGNEANSNSLPVDRSEVRGRKSVGSVIPSSSTAATDGGSSASSVGIGLSNIGRSIFPTWSKNTNHKTRSFDFDSSDSDVGESSTYEAQSRGINTTFSYDERDDVNTSNERSPIGSTASTWLRNRKSLGTENSVKHHINSTPPRTSTPVTRRSFGRPSENHSPVTDQASIYQGQNSSPSAIRQQLNSTRENHFTAEKIAEDQRLQNVFKAKGKVSKTNYTQHISMMLVLILGLFFLLLGILYISMKTDSSDLPMSDSKTENDLLICTQWQKAMAKSEEAKEKKRPCFEESVSLLAFKSISPLYDELSHRLSNYKCQKSSVGNMSRSDLTSFLDGFLQQQEVKGQKGHMYADVVISLVIHNPHWRIRAMKSEKEAASDMTEAEGVLYLESTVPGFMSLPCRLRNAVRRVTTQILIAVVILVFLAAAGAVTVYFVHYRVKHQEQQQKLVYDMVEKIIDVLRLHCETLHDEEEDKPYLAIQHVRDTLIAPAQRREYQAVWDKAVKFVELHESRVRVETQTIHGEDFTVWRWLQNCPKGQKVWQGQAFGEDKLNHVAKSPSPCLKVSNMFNADKENAGDWDVSVKDAILEKCADCQIVHIHVDRGSNEGVVYVKCSDEVHAGKAFKQLHGWWFDGKLVTVKYLKLEHYSRSFPRSAASSELLQPTTDRKLSLAQPFHSSSLEMT